MKVFYTLEWGAEEDVKSIYLAGPTHRIKEGESIIKRSWRDEAIKLLSEMGYNGVVYCPEWAHNRKPDDWTYSRQVSWELEAMGKSTVILFWVCRDFPTLPGLTTNIEFGEYLWSDKIVVGIPEEADHQRYLQERCSRNKISFTTDLTQSVKAAIDLVGQIKGKSQKIWFTADTHFGHERIMQLSKRPFKTVEEMSWEMIKNWNEVVKRRDVVYHLGDFGDAEYVKHLNGQIVLLKGNYETPEVCEELQSEGVELMRPEDTSMNIGGLDFELIHAPVDDVTTLQASQEGLFYLFGHIHKLQMVKTNGLNVGVDCHDFRPIDVLTVLFYRNAICNHFDENVFIPVIG